MNENENKLPEEQAEPTPNAVENETEPTTPEPVAELADDTDDEVEALVREKIKASYAESEAQTTTEDDNDVVMIPRATFNYAIIALVFFVLGALLGSFVFPRSSAPQTAALPDNFEEIVQDAVIGAFETAGVVEDPGLVMGQEYDLTVDISEDPFRGNPDAPITIIEFSDFTCGYCGRFATTTLEPLLAEYPDQVKLVYIDYPFLSQMSVPAALAAECAHDQGMFWEMHDLIFNNQQGMSPDSLRSHAETLELDLDAYDACFDEGVHIEEIRADLSHGQELGVSGTPAFFVNGRFVSGAQPVDVFRRFIDEELAALQS